MPKDAEPSMRQAYCMQLEQQNRHGSYTSPSKSLSPVCQHWDIQGMSEVNTQTLPFPSNALWRYPCLAMQCPLPCCHRSHSS